MLILVILLKCSSEKSASARLISYQIFFMHVLVCEHMSAVELVVCFLCVSVF